MRIPAVSAGARHATGAGGASRHPGASSRQRLARALSALVIAAGVLAVAHSPAQASAIEVDTDRLSGATRYETAVEIAEAYADVVEREIGRADIDTVIVTSGLDEHFAYVLPAPALSRRHNAPVLLTEPSDLPRSVSRFIERSDIEDVIILGDTSIVSASVEDEIGDLPGVDVERIAGSDAYSTAVEVAELVGSSPGRPGTFARQGRTALLATGAKFPDALAAGPLAYRGQHPVLLSHSDELPEDVVEFLDDSGTDHVVILGGTAAISTAVERELDALAIDVTRWRGPDRYETAVRIAEELLGNSSPQSCFDGSEVGLAYGRRSPDAIVSGPYLGELCAPLLLTELDSLPDGTSDALESDELFVGDASGMLTITVFGGSKAVSSSALRAAVRAAELDALGARITATEGGCQFSVQFDEPVSTSEASNVGNYSRDGAAFRTGEARVETSSGRSTLQATVVLAGGAVRGDAAVATGCIEPLEARDAIGVIGGRISAASDRRVVRQVSAFARADNARPRLSILALAGSITVWVESNEPIQGFEGSSSLAVEFQRPGEDSVLVSARLDPGATSFDVDIPGSFDNGDGLEARDRVVVHAGEVEDLAGNENVETSARVVADTTPPRASRITVSQHAPQVGAYAYVPGGSGTSVQQGPLQITTKAGAGADGAEGNEWTLEVELLRRRPSTWTSNQGSQATISTSRRTLTIDVLEHWTLGDLEDDLNANADFAALFEAEVIAGRHGLNPRSTEGRIGFVGGVSTVDITVYWTEPIQGCNFGVEDVRLDGILIDVNNDGDDDFAMNGTVLDPNSDVTFVGDNSGTTSIVRGTGACDLTTPGVRQGTLVARVQSGDVDNLPSSRSNGFILPNTAYDFAGNANLPQSRVLVRNA